ncbi:MAG: hypothetical protein HRU36_03045 [Rickettsiales bacterium]|nr:hypothetical protein [Rickettsiales bacterium]
MIKAKMRLYRVKIHLLLAVIGLLMIANLFLSLSLFRKDNMTILVPTIRDKMSVGLSFVDDEYLKSRADQIINTLFSIRSENADDSQRELLRQCDSESKAAFKNQIESLSIDIRKRGYYYVFRKSRYEIDNKKLQVLIGGKLETYLNNALFLAVDKLYRLSFINRGGVVNLISFEEMGG